MCIYGGCKLHRAQKTKCPGSHLTSLLHPASYHGSRKARSCRQDRKGKRTPSCDSHKEAGEEGSKVRERERGRAAACKALESELFERAAGLCQHHGNSCTSTPWQQAFKGNAQDYKAFCQSHLSFRSGGTPLRRVQRIDKHSELAD
jgi:hypothetical protein